MKKLNKDYLSKYRQNIERATQEIRHLCIGAAGAEPLLAGTPVQTYKTCGKPGCKCEQGGENRHGPYLAVQIRRDGKQRNLTLKKSEGHLIELAREYQRQMHNRENIAKLQQDLLEKVDNMLKARMIWDKK